jgi:glycosyltransferase involved in cell wall biosynthesis
MDENSRLGAEYQLVGIPPTARLELPLLLRVVVRNTGTALWPNAGANLVNLSYHWLDTHGQIVDFDGIRAHLPAPLPPGESVELELQVEPPPRAGEYLLALDMVEEGVAWFSIDGCAPLTIPISVADAPRNVRRACIIGPICMINDAVGNHMISQMRFLQAQGYETLILVEHVDARQPVALRQHMLAIGLADVQSGRITPLTRRALAYFRSADLYIFQYPIHYPLFEAIAWVDRGVAIVDYHGVTPPQFWRMQGEGYTGLVEGQRQIRLVRYADYAITHSNFTRDELLRTGAIDPRRIHHMGYVVPLERFQPGPHPEHLLQRYGLTPDQPVLLYVGRMAANKRIETLVRAFAHIRERLPHAVLLLIGDYRPGPYAQVVAEARELARTLDVVDGLIFAGQVPDAELPAHYQLADVFVTASLHEGFCIPVVEAMACGVPVVGTDTTALPETIGAGGLTFRPEDPADLAQKVLALLESRDGEQSTSDDRAPDGREVCDEARLLPPSPISPIGSS